MSIKDGIMDRKEKTETRRDFLKKGAYAAPVILSLKSVPAFASSGSGRGGDSSSDSSSEAQ
jgi:hypothetical protein